MCGDTVPHVVEDFFGDVRLLGEGSVVHGGEAVLMPAQPFPDVPGVQWKDVVYDATRGLKDFFGVVQLLNNGSIERGDESVLMPARPFLDVSGVQWKDVVYYVTCGLMKLLWLADSVDFARTFMSGVSAGANLAHHVVVQLALGEGHPLANLFDLDSPSLEQLLLPPKLVVALRRVVLCGHVLQCVAKLKEPCTCAAKASTNQATTHPPRRPAPGANA
ncbi:uncharacterized protein LOC133902133 [Phragmites australis]|uniref:uncharacterized protein LOC133902133 n=1 Tax=Phragmites australis TaxID=29695 RepID=UPI002D773037|nr:uncharacterized protein LOC133902133 [Phragmites australis]